MTVELATQLASWAFLVVTATALWYYRHRARVAEAADESDRALAATSAAAAQDATSRVQGLELERAKAIVDTFAEAQKEAARVTDPQEAVDRANSGLDALR